MQHDQIQKNKVLTFWPDPTVQQVYVRTELVHAWCCVLHSLNVLCNITYLKKCFDLLTEPPEPRVYKDRICACVVLYAPSPLIWYATGLLTLSHIEYWVRCGTWLYQFLIFAFFFTLTFWPHPRDSRLCVRTEYEIGLKGQSKGESIDHYMLLGSLCLLPFNFDMQHDFFQKKRF